MICRFISGSRSVRARLEECQEPVTRRAARTGARVIGVAILGYCILARNYLACILRAKGVVPDCGPQKRTGGNKMTIMGYRLGRRGFLTGMLGMSSLPLLGSLPAMAQDGTLTLFGDGDGSDFQTLLAAFEKVSGMKARWEGVPFADLQNTLVQRFRTGNSGIEVFLVDPTYVPIFAKAGMLKDLTSAFGEKTKGVLFPSDVQGATYNGKMLSMPFWESTQLLFFNKKLLAKAGVEAPGVSPEARMTWEELIALAKKVQAA
ncbi:MAG: extracellular solute-binding protein, partial [Mesorhizobium sp.]